MLAACAGDAEGSRARDAGPARDAGLSGDAGPARDGGRDAAPRGDAGSPGPDPGCAEDGCLRAVEDLGDWRLDALRSIVPADIPLENGYRLRRVVYGSGDREARAVVALPLGVPTPPGGFHVAVNNPGTVGLADACAPGESAYGAGLAGFFGARGLVGVAVDYPGLGTPGAHPYLVKDVAGRASLDAVRAALRLASWRGIAMSGRAVVTGLSQGGHATLAAAELAGTHAPELDVAGWAVAAPASLWLEHWRGGLGFAGDHHVYTAMLTWAWAGRYGVDRGALFRPDALDDVRDALETACLAGTTPTLFDALPDDPAVLYAPGYRDAWREGDLGAWPTLEDAWRENRAGAFGHPAPLLVLQGADDVVVLPSHTEALVAALEDAGADVTHRVVPDAGHVDVAFNALAVRQRAREDALAWLEARLDEGPR